MFICNLYFYLIFNEKTSTLQLLKSLNRQNYNRRVQYLALKCILYYYKTDTCKKLTCCSLILMTKIVNFIIISLICDVVHYNNS